MATKTCEKCDGTGWLFVKKGNVEAATRCDCFEKDKKSTLLISARIPKHYQKCELNHGKRENFQLMNPSIKKAHNAALSFVKKYPSIKAGLFFIGPCGVGKTHLAVGIMNYLLREKGVQCLFYDFRDLLKEIRNTYSENSTLSEHDVLFPVLTTEILVLDELGSQKMTDWVRDMLMYVINQRYNEDRTTIFTTNYIDKPDIKKSFRSKKRAESHHGSPDDEPSLSDRIGFRLRSRLNEMCKIIEIDGDDYRENKQAGY